MTKRRGRRHRISTTEPPSFASEAALCTAFAGYARNKGWDVHAETSDCDLLLVWNKPDSAFHRRGDIVGIQAKLRPNFEVLAQSLPSWLNSTGPDFHAVLVPKASGEFLRIAHALHISTIVPTTYGWSFSLSQRHHYEKKLWYPEVIVDVPAGVPSPRVVSKWKITAVKLCLYGLDKGYVTMADFQSYGLNSQRWVAGGWIVDTGEREIRLKKYRITELAPYTMFPEVTAALKKGATDVP